MNNEKRTKKQQVADSFNEIVVPDFGVDALLFTTMGRRLVEHAQIPRGAQVLDIAAGRGAILFPAADRVGPDGRVIGIDVAEDMVQATAADINCRNLNHVDIRQMDAEHLEFPPASFDRVLCGFALFFFPHLTRALSEFHRVLKPSGQFAATTFGEGPVQWEWYEQLLETYRISRSNQVPNLITKPLDTPAELKKELSQAGFIDIEVTADAFDAIYQDEEDWWVWVWSSGDRTVLETLAPDVLERFKADAFEKIQSFKQSDGIHRPYRVLFTIGTKPRD